MTLSHANDKERGFVLVIVLWFIAVLALLTTAFSLSARGGIKLVRTELISAKERALLDAGVELAAVHVAMTDPIDRWRADGSEYRKSYGRVVLGIRLYDQSGRIDINKSDPVLLLGLLRQFISEPKEAQRITEKIVEGRNPEATPWQNRKPGKADKRNSRSNGAAIGKYMDVSQLQYGAGISRDIYRKIRPFVTVHSDDGRINPLTAPPSVLMSVPSMTRVAADAFLNARQTHPMDKKLIEQLPSSTRKWFTDRVGRAIKVNVGVQYGSGRPGQVLSAVIMPLADKDAPFRVLRRRLMSVPVQAGEGG